MTGTITNTSRWKGKERITCRVDRYREMKIIFQLFNFYWLIVRISICCFFLTIIRELFIIVKHCNYHNTILLSSFAALSASSIFALPPVCQPSPTITDPRLTRYFLQSKRNRSKLISKWFFTHFFHDPNMKRERKKNFSSNPSKNINAFINKFLPSFNPKQTRESKTSWRCERYTQHLWLHSQP